MQSSPKDIEREARRRLPGLLSELLDEDLVIVDEPRSSPQRPDLVATDAAGRRWLIELKNAGGPGQVRDAGNWFGASERAGNNDIALLAVPYMTPSGAKAADELGLNWVDLAGNASISDNGVRILVRGRPNVFGARGRPSSPFAPKSARIARVLLIEPTKWWRQRDLVEATRLDDGHVSRIVRRLEANSLLETRDREFRARAPRDLLDAWADQYRFDKHDIVNGHISGSGIEVARAMSERLRRSEIRHAFTGLPAAWAIDKFASFRLSTIFVSGDPRDVAEQLTVRPAVRGANVQIVGPNDEGVFDGTREWDGLRCVSLAQAYLDLLHLPERASEAAAHLRDHHLAQIDDDS